MTDFTNAVLLIYAGLFPIINPIAMAPIFLGLTAHATDAERQMLARGVAINSFFLLVGSLFVGSHILEFFGITLPVVRIAGGLVIFAFGWKLLQSGVDLEDRDTPDAHTMSRPTESFYPLTMPLTVGPGSISVAIALGSQRPAAPRTLAEMATLAAAAIVGIVAIAATIYVCYRYAERLSQRLGKNGTNVVVRLSAFILLCIGTQILWYGYSALQG